MSVFISRVIKRSQIIVLLNTFLNRKRYREQFIIMAIMGSDVYGNSLFNGFFNRGRNSVDNSIKALTHIIHFKLT